jgi:hypothetical protein
LKDVYLDCFACLLLISCVKNKKILASAKSIDFWHAIKQKTTKWKS